MTPGVSPVPLAAMAKLTLEGGKSDLKADLKAEGADSLEPPSTPARGDTDAAETAAETAETDAKRPGTSVDEGLAAALAAGEAMYGEHSGFQVSLLFLLSYTWAIKLTPRVFCSHRV
jgi:hypothetical protein